MTNNIPANGTSDKTIPKIALSSRIPESSFAKTIIDIIADKPQLFPLLLK